MTTSTFKRPLRLTRAQLQRASEQKSEYKKLINRYSFGTQIGDDWNDYILLADINGIRYYAPDDELNALPFIYAIDHRRGIAADTGYYDMDDISDTRSGYTFCYYAGSLVPEHIAERENQEHTP